MARAAAKTAAPKVATPAEAPVARKKVAPVAVAEEVVEEVAEEDFVEQQEDDVAAEAEVENAEVEVEVKNTEEAAVSIYDEVLAVCNAGTAPFAPRNSKEDKQKYLYRMLDTVSTVEPVDLYDNMSVGAKEWYDAGITATEKNHPIVAPVGFSDMGEAPAASAPKPKRAGNGEALKAYREGEKAKKEAAIARGEVPAPKVKKEKKEKGPRVEGSLFTIRRVILSNLTADAAEIARLVAAKGIVTKMSTISTTRAGTLDAYNAMKEMGMLK